MSPATLPWNTASMRPHALLCAPDLDTLAHRHERTPPSTPRFKTRVRVRASLKRLPPAADRCASRQRFDPLVASRAGWSGEPVGDDVEPVDSRADEPGDDEQDHDDRDEGAAGFHDPVASG